MKRSSVQLAVACLVAVTFAVVTLGQVKVDPKVFSFYVGDYSLGANRLLVIGRTLATLNYLEPDSGRTGPLIPLSETEYFAGPSQGISAPIELRVKFLKNTSGEVTGIVWNRNGLPEVTALKTKLYQEEAVQFHSNSVALSGTLRVPLTEGPHPAVVLTHGSGGLSRNGPGANYLFLADYFARRGIAALTYDKRGVGASTGDWEEASFDDLAGDALAGVELLKSRTDINRKQIGLWGLSQGAWLVELAASQSKDIAFIIAVSGGGVNPEFQEIKRTELQMRADGYSEEDIQQAVALQTLKFRFARTGEGWDEYEAAFQKTHDKKWFSVYVDAPSSKNDSAFPFWRRINSFEPVPVLVRVTCPVLVVLGERDTITPVTETIAGIERARKQSKNRDYTIKVFPKANHSLLEAETGGDSERPNLKNFVPGYFETMTNWIMKKGIPTN
jgi:pimeloyl-ACP methyl ester carboxylesterase